MSSPAAYDRYQSAVHASDSPMPRLGRQAERAFGQPRRQGQGVRFGRMRSGIALPPGFPAEARTERIDQFVNPAKACGIGPEIDSARRGLGRFHERLGEREVSSERLEHVLPGPDGIRIAQPDRLARLQRSDTVRNQPVGGPIAAADDVARARRGDRRAAAEEALAKAAGQQLGAGLAAAVRIVSAEPIGFLERPLRAVILIDLVAGDDHHALQRVEPAACLQQRPGAEDIGGVRAERIAIGFPDQRLRGHVDDDLRIGVPQRLAHLRGIADIADDRSGIAAHDVP